MDEFYKIISTQEGQDYTEYIVKINKEHKVFTGHFPGNPIVPGVMSMMMVRECIENKIGRKTRFASISQCKYQQAIIPDDNQLIIRISIDDNLNIKGEIISNEGRTLMTIKGTLI